MQELQFFIHYAFLSTQVDSDFCNLNSNNI